MKLACVRCKRKKIKCDKGEPACHQCTTAHADCQYVERRQRPKLAQQRAAVTHLSHRLELLEKQLTSINPNDSSCSPPVPLPPVEPEVPTDAPTISDVPSPKVSLMTGDGPESWVYRMASDVRRNFQAQTTPVSTPTPRIDHAMSSLNEALEDLARLRVRTDACQVGLILSIQEQKQCVEAFLRLTYNMIIPDTNIIPFDVKLLRSMPDLIDSPYVKFDPGMYVLYYNALYYGIQEIRGPEGSSTRAIYLRILEAVPAWLDCPKLTEFDGHIAALTSWTAVTSHDYQLSWKFHCKACQFVKIKKIDQLDALPARTQEEEDKRDIYRYLYWQILSTDMIFRLFYGKPSVIRWAPNKVKPPVLFNPNDMHPSANRTTVLVLWVRYIHSTAEIINKIDGIQPCQNQSIEQEVDEFCKGLEDLMIEWNIETLVNDQTKDDLFRYLLADHIMNIYALIIGIKRLIKSPDEQNRVPEVALRAARKVTRITLDFTQPTNDANKAICSHFISFYPFCAVFALYEHILACGNPADCAQDIAILDRIGTAMTQTSQLRADFLPFARTINALNKVCNTIQDERRKQADKPTSTSSSSATPQNPFTAENLDVSAFPEFSGFPISFDESYQPFGLVRALENDVIMRNWNEAWWDMGADLEAGMHGVDDGAHAAQYTNLPTPHDT